MPPCPKKFFIGEDDAVQIGINTFGIARQLSRDFCGALGRLREIGYSFLEPCIYFDGALPRPVRAGLRFGLRIGGTYGGLWQQCYGAEELALRAKECGFSILSVHSFLPVTKSGCRWLEEGAALLERIGAKFLVVSPMKGSIREAERLIPALREASDFLYARGISLLLHNHAPEFAREADGRTRAGVLLAAVPRLGLEPDTGWAQVAGQDPAQLLHAYASRVGLLHLKDIAAAKKKPRFTAIGEGILPLRDVLREAKKCAFPDGGVIVDQDRSEGDLWRDLHAGFTNISRAWAEEGASR